MRKGGRRLTPAERGSRCTPGPHSPGLEGPKIVFYARDVAALRATLIARGAKLGKARRGEICLCDGKDPDGDPIQLSDR